ncbi:Gfo/Idh/MocA family oxidoreductase [Blastopirellula sp. JC732]|uniref:Gfo/Idh/MocA family oxidoreductase n=1 Tax=Blastopirellula sediminis TaxID=2894196 RepID=A0A9X1SHP9_9BACT|nr:Gfo/Idh/MocA family oxidoreductase [Blastopirellula sediminis]MCC9607818.1 Gfo/Idh/MocA family oxidoreductase [Blastopirellula sediminis]MCC9627389.1 Gfo/Idh/MocA family oxidoreductase [Blastopirellula sediminis]
MSLGFAIVGCGMIADFHARAIADLRGAKLVACYSRNGERAAEFASKHGCAAYSDLDQMLADPAVDIVSICTPSGAHMEPGVAAARAGKHVIIEKPLEITLKRCDKLISECEKAGVKLSTIFPSRFHGPSVELKKAIEAGRFGTLTMGDAYVKWFRTQAYYDSGAWRGTWALDGGGALMNQAIHSVDLLCWLMGDVEEISAYTSLLAHERIEVEDVAVASLKFKSGALGVIQASTASYPGFLKRIEISGSQGSAIMEEEDLKKWEFAKMTKKDQAIQERLAGKTHTGGGAADPKAIGHHGHTAQFKDFVDAIKKDREPLINGPEGRRAVEVILAIYKAAETGKSVQLPLKSDPVLKARSGK